MTLCKHRLVGPIAVTAVKNILNSRREFVFDQINAPSTHIWYSGNWIGWARHQLVDSSESCHLHDASPPRLVLVCPLFVWLVVCLFGSRFVCFCSQLTDSSQTRHLQSAFLTLPQTILWWIGSLQTHNCRQYKLDFLSLRLCQSHFGQLGLEKYCDRRSYDKVSSNCCNQCKQFHTYGIKVVYLCIRWRII